MSGIALVKAQRSDLEAALDGPIDNVFAHTPEHTAFAVAVRSQADGRMRLTVEDNGPGIAADAVARGDISGRSTGLGLDIVRRVAAASGGLLLVSNREGGGARVDVEFGLPRLRRNCLKRLLDLGPRRPHRLVQPESDGWLLIRKRRPFGRLP